MYYLLGHFAHFILLLFIVWRAYQTKAPLMFLVYTCIMLYMVDVEIYREMLRFVGLQVVVGPGRAMYYRLIFFVWGFYYGLLAFYHEKFITGDLVQAHYSA